jgi:hypothetical protein
MGQYRLWLHHREIDQDLHTQQAAYDQELAAIDEQIAHIENTAMQSSNALVIALIQQFHAQKEANSKEADTIITPPEQDETIHETAPHRQRQVPLPSNYGQQSTSVSPALLAWSQLPNFNTHEIHISEEHILPADVLPMLPDATDHLLPSDLNSLFDDEPKDTQRSLPWWLRSIMRTPHEEPEEPQKTAPIDQQSMHINQRVERWFARRNKLLHNSEWQEGQKK